MCWPEAGSTSLVMLNQQNAFNPMYSTKSGSLSVARFDLQNAPLPMYLSDFGSTSVVRTENANASSPMYSTESGSSSVSSLKLPNAWSSIRFTLVGVVGVSLAKVDACRVRTRTIDRCSVDGEPYTPNRVIHQSNNLQEDFARETQVAQFSPPDAMEHRQAPKRVVAKTQEAKWLLSCCETLLLVVAQHAGEVLGKWDLCPVSPVGS